MPASTLTAGTRRSGSVQSGCPLLISIGIIVICDIEALSESSVLNLYTLFIGDSVSLEAQSLQTDGSYEVPRAPASEIERPFDPMERFDMRDVNYTSR